MKKLLLVITTMAFTCAVNAGQRDYAKLDVNDDAKLTLPEFLVHIKPQGVENMTKEFHRRDKDQNGTLTALEYTLKKK